MRTSPSLFFSSSFVIGTIFIIDVDDFSFLFSGSTSLRLLSSLLCLESIKFVLLRSFCNDTELKSSLLIIFFTSSHVVENKFLFTFDLFFSSCPRPFSIKTLSGTRALSLSISFCDKSNLCLSCRIIF